MLGGDPTVQVALRIRPLLPSEVVRGCRSCIQQAPGLQQIKVLGTAHAFSYNFVFGPETSQANLYSASVRQLVHRLFDGFNVTVLAYGQTSSGKTFSMGTCASKDEEKGVIQRAVNDIFNQIRSLKKWKFHVNVSFLELYREQVFDLLASSRSLVDIRENDNGVVVPGLTEVTVKCAEETLEELEKGSIGRATGSTPMNAKSSRSHAVFTISIHKYTKKERRHSCQCKFHVVDLAGSERQGKTKSSGDRLKEGISINRGLLALGNVISALGSDYPKGHVSFRDSKLTRLLQQSLGGNSLTLLIACVSPADYNLSETLSTLRYADRAKKIRNKPVANVTRDEERDDELIRLRAEVESLQRRVNLETNTDKTIMESRLSVLINRNSALLRQLNEAFNENINLVEGAEKAELTRDRIKERVTELKRQYSYILFGLLDTCPPTLLRQLHRVQQRIDDVLLEVRRSDEELYMNDLSNGTVLRDKSSLKRKRHRPPSLSC